MRNVIKPECVPDDAVQCHNVDGSTSWSWDDRDGLEAGTYTTNCPKVAPIYFESRGAVPIPAAIIPPKKPANK